MEKTLGIIAKNFKIKKKKKKTYFNKPTSVSPHLTGPNGICTYLLRVYEYFI